MLRAGITMQEFPCPGLDPARVRIFFLLNDLSTTYGSDFHGFTESHFYFKVIGKLNNSSIEVEVIFYYVGDGFVASWVEPYEQGQV